jgi:hypothetical protein
MMGAGFSPLQASELPPCRTFLSCAKEQMQESKPFALQLLVAIPNKTY